MKTFALIILSFIATTATAQNVLVRFYPANQPFLGLTNYPAVARTVEFSTNAPDWHTNMSATQYEAHLSALRPTYEAGQSNAVWIAKQALDDDLAELVTAYSNLTWCAQNFDRATNIANLRICVKATGDVLLKLKPVLTEVYQRK